MIRLRNVSVTYWSRAGSTEALKGIDLDIGSEFLGVVGPSGCGKTTLLRILAGLVGPQQGFIDFDSESNFSYGIVFQDYSLLPWLTARQNIELGLKIGGVPTDARREVSRHLLGQLGLEDAADLLPHQLSGGMRQRVAIGRAFAPSPPLLLMDEPFGALDAITREGLQETLAQIYESEPHTVVFVTHDVQEALLLSDRVCVLTARPGRVSALVDVPFPRPRRAHIRRQQDFLRLMLDVQDLLRPRNHALPEGD